jgi:hypothetical protein
MTRLKSDEPFFVLNGDVLCDVDTLAMWKALPPRSAGILLGILVEDISQYGEILADGDRILNFVEKRPEHRSGIVNGGVYLFQPGIRAYFPKRVFNVERDVFPFVPDLRVFVRRPAGSTWGPERLEASRLFGIGGRLESAHHRDHVADGSYLAEFLLGGYESLVTARRAGYRRTERIQHIATG